MVATQQLRATARTVEERHRAAADDKSGCARSVYSECQVRNARAVTGKLRHAQSLVADDWLIT